ncbi:LysR substrate-binding domain-containing protein [Vibrio sp. WXL103]|uniref:LysR substrate-binding domain-containing protein n=1 Tax=unclassified Vibrio TaxID=2614977 RepID=UPI003EC50A83
MKLPPLEAVRYFEAAARHLSFTLAAEELFVSQSAVSQKVIQLEERLGYKLFYRKPRQLLLTERGSQLLPLVSSALNQIHDAFHNTSQADQEAVLRLCCQPSFASCWLLPLLSDFYQRFPDTVVNLVASLNQPDSNHNCFDISLSHGFGDQPQMLQKELFRDYIYPVATPELVERYQLDDLSNLAHVPLLHDSQPQAKLSTSWQRWLMEHQLQHIDTSKGYSFNRADLVVNAALAGQGVALGRHVLVAQQVAKGNLVPLTRKVTPDQSVYLVCQKGLLEHKQVAEFIDWIERVSRNFEHECDINKLMAKAI